MFPSVSCIDFSRAFPCRSCARMIECSRIADNSHGQGYQLAPQLAQKKTEKDNESKDIKSQAT